jgi:flagellar assembly factor FliW
MNRVMVPEAVETTPRGVGGVAVDPKAVVNFPDGLPGFELCRSFVLLSSPETEPLQQLQSVDGPEASFVGIDPKLLLPTYRCELSEFDRERLGANDDSVLLWLAIVAIDADGTATANLRAPVVINPETMTGRQVMPHRCLYALRHVITEIE